MLRSNKIRIEGHTDDVGDAGYNLELSNRRAYAVKEMLVNGYGLPNNRFDVVGFGEMRPTQSNEFAVGRAKNRRVTIVNLGPQ